MAISSPSVHWTRLPGRVPFLRYFWRLFTSVRFALILILMLAGGFFLGVIISQVPQELGLNSQDYTAWVESVARPRYGAFTNVFFLLGLFDVFHAVWFRSLLILLFVAITVCTLNRFPAIYQSTVKAKPVVNESFLSTAKYRAAFQLRDDLASLTRTLREHHYRLTIVPDGGKTHVYADKNGWAKYCTFASHLGLLLFLFGGLITNAVGYQRFLIIPDGMSQPIYSVFHPEQMQVFNEGFTVEYLEDGRPKDYYSDLVIYKDGKEAARGRIRVNSPMDFDGFRFHQNSFGPTVRLQIQSESGQVLFSETMVLGQAFGKVPFDIVSIPTTDISAVVALVEGNTTTDIRGGTFVQGGQEARLAIMAFTEGMASQPDFVVRLAPGETKTEAGLVFSFQGTYFFSGVVARKDPGAVFIWTAAALFVPALGVTFWFARRRMWFQVVGQEVRMAGMADRYVDMREEIDKIVSDVAAPAQESPRTPETHPTLEESLVTVRD